MFDLSLLDPPERIRKLSRLEFDKLVELGVFEDERVELLRGLLVTMSPQGAPHSAITAWFARRFGRLLDDTFEVRSHSSFAATDDSEPEPDVSISRSVARFEHPSEAFLLIEVSESSLRKDQRIKAPIYGEARVPEYWIVDISGDDLVIHVHTQPSDDGYRCVEVLRTGDVLRPVQLPGVEIAVADIPWYR